VDFEDGLAALGFAYSRGGRGGTTYGRAANAYLTYYVQDLGDAGALFTWEFAIAEYVAGLGLQVGSDEHLNTFLYPRTDARGPREPVWVSEQMDRAEELLRSLSFVDVEPQGD
jgi:hypothetical protein